MQVNKDPPHEVQKGTYLYQWETKARRFFHYFEVHKKAAHEWIQRFQANPFTKTQEFLRYHGRMKGPEILELRQQLGDVSKAEVNSVNQALGKESPYYFRKGRGEPAKIVGYRKNILLVAGASFLGVAYTMIYRRKGFVWWVAPFLPVVLYFIYNKVRQPTENVANCFRFIIAKRVATAQMAEQDKEYAVMKKNDPKLNELSDYLKVEKKTVYELEKKMIDDIVGNKF